MYISNQVDSQTLADSVDQDALEQQVVSQALESGFVDEAIACLSEKIEATESFQTAYNNLETMDQNLTISSAELMAATTPTTPATGTATKANRTQFTVEDVIVDANFIYSDHFDDGVGIELGITATLSVTKRLTTGKEASLKIELSASIQQEIAVDIDVNVDTDWTVYVIIPVLTELYCNSAVELESYSAISLGAKIYTVSEDVEKKWTALNGVLTDEMKGKLNADTIRKIDNLATKLKTLKKNSEGYTETLQQIANYKAMLPSIEVDGEMYSVEQLEEELGVVSVTEELGELLDVDSQDEMDTGIAEIMDKYADMLENESDWVELFNKELFNKDFYINIVAINLKVNFIVKANVNIALAANLEYQIGKRYTFWVKVFSQQSGSNEVDLCDERFAFQFYIMGTLGIKAGVKAEVSVGLFSTKIGSIGVNVEFGPYFKLWGYFIYEYTKLRPAGETEFTYDETMLGAIYMEVGLYVTLNFKAQLFDNTIKYEPTIYSTEIPLLTVGQKDNVYDFAMDGDSDDKLIVKDSDSNSSNGITMQLPEDYLNMKEIDLKNAEQSQNVYPYGDFIYSFSSDKFSIDDNGMITVTPGQFERYLTSNLTITWNRKVAFSDYDMSITVPVIWTNYTNAELNEKYTAMVKVGNSTEGYTTKWSERYSRIDTFDLPTQEEILDMINYDSYDYNGVNVKYDSKGSYKEASTDLTIDSNKLYYYDIELKKYSVVVEDVENADGTKKDMEYTLTYGQEYDFTELESTGTNNADQDAYTKFYNLTDSNGNEISLTGTVDIAFLEAIEQGELALTANYADNSATATYIFTGSDAPSVTITFQKGDIPDFEYADYLSDYNSAAEDIYPIVAPAYTSVTYTLSCKSTVPTSYYDMIFDTKGGSTINTRNYPVGSVVTRPLNPVRDGYTFDGWYTDEEYTEAYEFTSNGEAIKMPENDVTLYAKWSANTYKVSFFAEGGELKESSEREVTYDSKYGNLPTPTLEHYYFLGWYTDVNEESTKITSESIYNTVGDQELHAKWYEKQAIVLPAGVLESQTYTFEEDKEYEFKLDFSEYSDSYTGPTDNFVIQYRKENSTILTEQKPTEAGNYLVYISRAEDDKYLEYLDTKKVAHLDVTKANITLNNFSVITYYDSVVAKTPSGIPGNGTIKYRLYNSSNVVVREWQTSPIFTGVGNGTFYVKMKVEEGTNYLASDEKKSDNSVTTNYSTGGTFIYYRIKTCENGSITDNYGTDSEVYGYAIIAQQFSGIGNTSKTSAPTFDYHGNDFNSNDDDLYYVCEVNAPWQIAQVGLGVEGDSDSWKVNNVRVGYTSSILSTDDLVDNKDDSISYRGYVEINGWLNDTESTYNSSFMKRNIASVGDFERTLSDVDLDTTTSDYVFEYNGLVTDDYYTNYNAFEKFSPPTMQATFASDYTTSAYDRYITYTDCKTISVDYDALKTQMKRDGITSLTLNLRLMFSETTTTTDTNTHTNSVKFTCDAENNTNVASNELSTSSYMGCAYYDDNNSIGLLTSMLSSIKATCAKIESRENFVELQSFYNDVMLNNPILINASTATGNANGTVDVTLNISNNPGIWGILANVTYDHSALELISYKSGDVFSSDDLFDPESLGQEKYTLLATNTEFENVDNNGTMVTLTFKIKSDADNANYSIGVNVIDIIDSNGIEINSSVTNGSVDVQPEENDVPNTGDSTEIIEALEKMIFGFSVFALAYNCKSRKKEMHNVS